MEPRQGGRWLCYNKCLYCTRQERNRRTDKTGKKESHRKAILPFRPLELSAFIIHTFCDFVKLFIQEKNEAGIKQATSERERERERERGREGGVFYKTDYLGTPQLVDVFDLL